MRLLLLACLALLAGCASNPARERAADTLILISIDGFRADFLQRGQTPVLASLAREGVRAESLRPAFPTLTFPNHYTLVTGLYPDHHGIINNRMTDPATGKRFVYKERESASDPAWWGGEPIWAGAERQGVRTATMFWPGSDVEIAGTRPGHWLPFDAAMTPSERVDQLLRWLDLPLADRPRFLTLYFEQVDHA
ncbi:MAG TPA: ectonucleotide pyrophosphatase/phosphodiesterase, partial [Dokdonella sp.]